MTRFPILPNDHSDLFCSNFANCFSEVCLALRKTRGADALFQFSIPTFCNTTTLSLSSTFPLLHAAGWWRDQGEQVLREGSGGDAGVDADHHVLDVLIHALPPPFCEHAASWSKYGSLNSQASLVLKLFQLLNCPRRLYPYRAHIFPFIEKVQIPSNLT